MYELLCFQALKGLFDLLLGYDFLIFGTAMAQTQDSISREDALSKIKSGALVIDVRSADEFNSGHIAGAINIPHTEIVMQIAKVGDDKTKEIVVYCKSGRRAGLALQELQAAGFSHVYNAGGYEGLK